ncbi:NADH dehydrogenase [ubiquinone] 1 alpha subcomplex subunit 13 [Onthophagus taurus]|uniref:NADH dehydrogenase [ubiquinone] 1 alpha subcomplex subunit 13 n=1 Tax=Onthophagus taurus TaxID=166361 RepID=UPI000C20B9A2|nr:NADH dehydrogenase [ubiquinone] 1 alpha subcomplex subunit 13 [Onthophagus taurus]
MSAIVKRQDMPPPGGYKPINFKRIPAKTYFSGFTMIAGYLGVTAGAAYVYYLTCKKVHREDIEERSARFALTPLLTAERDREYLKQLRRNRDEERELMKNVDGWVVGTLYGEPIYKDDKGELIEPRLQDYYVHANAKDFLRRADLSKMC